MITSSFKPGWQCCVRDMFGADAKVIESRRHRCRCGRVVMISLCSNAFGTGWTTDVHDGCRGEAWATSSIDPEHDAALKSGGVRIPSMERLNG